MSVRQNKGNSFKKVQNISFSICTCFSCKTKDYIAKFFKAVKRKFKEQGMCNMGSGYGNISLKLLMEGTFTNNRTINLLIRCD